MDIKVIRRGRKLQFVTILTIGDRQVIVSIARTLKAGVKTGKEGTDAFLDAIVAGGEIDDAFAAMRDRTDIDPQAELLQELETGKQELLSEARRVLRVVASRGKAAEELLADLAVGNVTQVEPSQGKGICQVCYEEFPLHHIGGLSDLCRNHINPGFI